jgi:hypothetical protein
VRQAGTIVDTSSGEAQASALSTDLCDDSHST